MYLALYDYIFGLVEDLVTPIVLQDSANRSSVQFKKVQQKATCCNCSGNNRFICC